jgi:hypothetical protein
MVGAARSILPKRQQITMPKKPTRTEATTYAATSFTEQAMKAPEVMMHHLI